MLENCRVWASARLPGTGAILLAATAVSCSQPPPSTGGSDRVIPSYDADTGRLERITYDRNGDGKLDAFAYMDGTRVVRAELDENYDGAVDRWEFYVAGTGTERTGGTAVVKGAGVLSRVEQSTNGDGSVTRRETYREGALASAEEDTDGDGRVDKWETWTSGALAAIAMDTQGRGAPDRRLVYPADGSEPRLEVDPDGTGQFRPAPIAGR
jgi:hypothetical protein